MPPRKQPSAPTASASDDRTERLIASVEMLAQEVNVLRSAIDDIRAELEYAVKILKTNLWLPTAQSADPPSQGPQLPSPKPQMTEKAKEDPAPEDEADVPSQQGHLF
jgi:hypothetical protein